jgi:hypothetical protein
VRGRGAYPPPFTLSTITSNVVMYAPAERADTVHSPYFNSTHICTVLCRFTNSQWSYVKVLGRNPDKSLKTFFPLFNIHIHLNSFALRLFFFKVTQPLIVSRVQLLYTVKEKEGKPDRKSYLLPYD